MARPKLHIRYQDGTASEAAVFKEVEGSVLQIGSDFGASTTSSPGHIRTNGVAHFQDRLYTINDEHIWEYVPASGDSAAWSSVYALSSSPSPNSRVTGFFPMLKDGAPVLVCLYRTAVSTMSAVFVSSSGTFSEVGGLTFTDSGWTSPVVHKNQLVWTGDSTNTGQHNAFDPDAETVSIGSAWSTDGAGESSANLIVFGGELYGIQANSNDVNDAYKIHRIEGTTATELFEFGTTSFTFQGGNGRNASFTDGTELYHIGFLGSSPGWELSRINLGSSDGADLTSLLPAGMQGGVSDTDGRVWVYNNIEDGTNEITMAWTDGDSDSDAVNFYRWDGESTGFTFLGSSAASTWALVHDHHGGGHRTFSASGELNAQLIEAQAVGTNFQLSFQIFGDNQTNVICGWLFDLGGEQPQTQCDIASPSAGSLSGNFITGLTADNGSTTYTVSWLAGSQFVSPGDFPRIVPRTFLG